MKISKEIQNCISIDQVVDLINKTSEFYVPRLVAEYAVNSCESKEKIEGTEVFSIDKDELLCRLSLLNDAGANFDSGEVEQILRKHCYLS